MKPEYLTRQRDLIPVEVLGEHITIIGAGAIGSFTALALAKMGFGCITVFDDDQVDEENMNCQFYPPSYIGKPKVAALKALVHEFTGVLITEHKKRWTKDEGLMPGIVISAVDNMAVRKEIWERATVQAFRPRLVIDPRMAAEVALCFAMDPSSERDRESYPKSLYGDAEAVQERCTAKSTVYCTLGISSLVASIVKSFAVGDKYVRTMQWDFKSGQMQSWLNDKA